MLILLVLTAFGSSHRDNTHSAFYEHDRAGRLVGEHYGALKTDGFEGIDHAGSPAPRVQSYGLDLLNRRVGTGSDPGISVWQDLNQNGVIDANEITLSHDHVVDKRGVLTGIDDGSTVASVSHDPAGAITQYDGRTIYYDWLGRPVLVLNSSTEAPVVAYAYDAFGRLAKRTAPWPSDPSKYREETYHYDGVRRIQEVFTDPVAATPPWPQLPGGGGVGGNPQTVRTEAEYIWSAAWGQPFDTCHVQIDWWDREAWFIQDHQTGTVRAYTDPSGEIAEQYGFDAFGNLIRRDQFPLVKTGSQGYYRTFRQRLGHQGLFVERVDHHTNARVLDAGVELWCQSRSRWYLPELGRFMTPDPNATGIPVVGSLAMHGMAAAGPPGGSFGWEDHYGDGWDVWTAYGANPVMAQDPTGLFFFVDMLGSQPVQKGLKTYGTYDKLQPIIGFVKNLMAGVNMQQAMLMMATDFAFNKAGGKAFDRAVGGASQAGKLLRNNRLNGFRGEDALRSLFGGSKRSVGTSLGRRDLDNVFGSVAQESKVGYTSLSRRIRKQIDKDAEILANRQRFQITEVEWHFFKSPSTNAVGPSGPLRAELEKRGIRVIIHDSITIVN